MSHSYTNNTNTCQRKCEIRSLAENIHDPIYRYDRDCRHIYVNHAVEKLCGLSASDLLGKTPTESLHAAIPNDRLNVMKSIQHVITTGKVDTVEVTFENTDGSYHYFQHLHVPEFSHDQTVKSVLAIGRDISAYKNLQKELLSRENMFRALAENSPDAIIRYDTLCRKIYVNAMTIKAFNRSAAKLLGKTPKESKLLLNYKEFELKLQEVIHTKQESMLEVSTLSSGEHLWAEVRLIPEFDDHEELISVLAVGRHITKRKKLEMHLNATLSQFEQFINNITEMAWIKDKEGKYIIVNQVLANRFGVSAQEMIGKHDSDFFDEKTSKAHIDVDLQVMKEKITVKVEEMISPNPDHEIWIESIKNPFRDSHGKIIGTIGTARDITERKHAERQMAFMAQHDTLTNLPNRALAKDRAEQAIAYAKRNDSKVAFLFIDLDKFKDINDSLGHLAGDTILKLITSRLGSCIRETDTLSRQGGDEFLIILSHIHHSHDVLITIDKIFKMLEDPFRLGNHTLFTSVSIGVSLYPDDGITFNKLYQRADIAMYQAKAQGRNIYAFHSSHISSAMVEQLKLQNDLRVAIKNSELILHYQPKIDLNNHHITGVEALIRWIHPERGLISPLTFIPLAESSGLIVEIGEWVLIEACKQAAFWHQKQLYIHVAVNISAIQFKRGNLEAVVKKALDLSGLDPNFLELELTESIFIHNTHETLKMIQNLKEVGVMLSIDDFGTGYSSLTYLKRFKVDKLKIDRSFIQNLLQDQEDAVIVKTIIQMAKSLNLKTIAEGVEDQEVLDIMYHYGCDEVQGYYFAKPMEAQNITSHIDTTMKWVR
ncbi:sensor domain-containing protein [Sulfurospirillum arsenophilum]|uniref:sensor domain-containing protein n=1 Tax=Sulfurospirillum arsenophilum TaxID=56698 RepID=UPI0006950571|nr:bifunctional diguanylate cyclase/phosphodiesterase [Sulfurospirillum arsenophilum]